MKNFLNGFIIIALLLSSINLYSQSGKIKGRVYDEKNNEPLPFTNIVIWGTSIGSTSDLDGNFLFTGLEPGYVQLAVSSVGYEKVITEEILVTNANVATINIAMKETSLKLEEVVVKASPFKIKKESPLSLRTLQLSEIEKNPGSNRDISKVIQSLPGVSSTVSFRNDIIVRGGGANENRFYLDGIEIPNINHFATQGSSGGPVGIINSDFISEVDFYSGAFPANRGNALSSILEMKQKEGNSEKMKYRTSLGASELALTLDGPISKNSSLIFSVRRSYLGFLFDIIGLPFLPTFNDYQFKYKIKFDQKNELTIIGLGALDQFKLNTGIENPDETQRYILGYLPINEQWSYTTGFNYKHFREKSFSNIIFSRNMLENRSYKYLNNDETSENNLLQNYISRESENKFRYENTMINNDFKLNYGTGLEYVKYENSTFQKVFLQEKDTFIEYNSLLDLFKWNLFGQISKSYLKDKLSLSFGLRMDANNYSKSMSNIFDQLSPRISASYTLFENLKLNLNTGRFYQVPAYTTLGYRNYLGELVNKNNGLKYIKSDHFVAGIEYLPNTNSKITVEGFYKLYNDYPFSNNDSISLANKGGDFGTVGDEEVSSTSSGRAYGFEVYLREKNFKNFNIILSYTFVRSEFEDIFGLLVPTSWDNKHILNITVSRSFKKNWDVGLKWRFVDGAPYTPYDIEKSSLIAAWDVRGRGYLDYSKLNTLRFNPYHQLDIRVDKQFYFDKWSLMLYLDIQNAYNFKGEEQAYLTNLDVDGNKMIDPNNPSKYLLRTLEAQSGTVLPTIGLMIEF